MSFLERLPFLRRKEKSFSDVNDLALVSLIINVSPSSFARFENNGISLRVSLS